MIKNTINIMETRTEIINKLFEVYGFQSYLEIGVRIPAENFDKINAKLKHSVDPTPLGSCTHTMTSDVFFKKHVGNQKYDVIFVDGMHTAEQVYVDIMNSINHLNDDGFIVTHDCNPPTEYHIRSYDEYLKTKGEWNGTVFSGFIKAKRELNDWSCFVVNEDWGCGIITKRKLLKNNSNEYSNLELSWTNFNENREAILQLTNSEEYIKMLNNDKSINN
jgi:hypothetical protein